MILIEKHTIFLISRGEKRNTGNNKKCKQKPHSKGNEIYFIAPRQKETFPGPSFCRKSRTQKLEVRRISE